MSLDINVTAAGESAGRQEKTLPGRAALAAGDDGVNRTTPVFRLPAAATPADPAAAGGETRTPAEAKRARQRREEENDVPAAGVPGWDADPQWQLQRLVTRAEWQAQQDAGADAHPANARGGRELSPGLHALPPGSPAGTAPLPPLGEERPFATAGSASSLPLNGGRAEPSADGLALLQKAGDARLMSPAERLSAADSAQRPSAEALAERRGGDALPLRSPVAASSPRQAVAGAGLRSPAEALTAGRPGAATAQRLARGAVDDRVAQPLSRAGGALHHAVGGSAARSAGPMAELAADSLNVSVAATPAAGTPDGQQALPVLAAGDGLPATQPDVNVTGAERPAGQVTPATITVNNPHPPGSPAWLQATGAQLAMFIRNGVQHAEIRLHPEELGALQINLSLQQDRARLQIISEHAQVRQVLEAALPQLRTALAGSGVELSQSQVSADGSSGRQPQEPPPARRTSGSGVAAPASEEPLPRQAAAVAGHPLNGISTFV